MSSLKRRLPLLLAGVAGLGTLMVSSGTAFAALPDGGTPLLVQGGVGLPRGTNSVRVTLQGTGSLCSPIDGTNNIRTRWIVREQDVVSVDPYTDRACQGARIGAGVAYRLTYAGPDPVGGFSGVLVSVRTPRVLICANAGWTDGDPASCR
ncbi:hypothetical protein ABZX85_38425 [Streptomyces sp. NPDC004539]|uniref:hypothetical protein n=1 Tax=Streptomyces sp. NPDC004539 TaxID=3154280 RepID=UPI0033BA0A19